MKFKAMDRVRIVSDTMNFDLPVHAIGYVQQVDRHIDTGLPYLVRVPTKKESWWVPECDIESDEQWTSSVIEGVLKELVINHALDTRNLEMFQQTISMRSMPDE